VSVPGSGCRFRNSYHGGVSCWLVNPGAGSLAWWGERLRAALAARRCRRVELAPPGEVAPQVRAILEKGERRLLVGGGDGTVAQVAGALSPGEAELGIVPLGTGNDLARSMGLRGEIESLLDQALGGPVVPVDRVRVWRGAGVPVVVNAAGGGCFGAPAGHVDEATKRRWGWVAYRMAALRRLGTLTAHRMRLEADGREASLAVWGMAAANGRFAGGGFTVAPRARLDDGLLDVLVVPSGDAFETFAAAVDVIFRRQEGSEHVLSFRARRLRASFDPPMGFSMDGEPCEVSSLELEVEPRTLNLVVGTHPVALGG